jgi:hypothetical protein
MQEHESKLLHMLSALPKRKLVLPHWGGGQARDHQQNIITSGEEGF